MPQQSDVVSHPHACMHGNKQLRLGNTTSHGKIAGQMGTALAFLDLDTAQTAFNVALNPDRAWALLMGGVKC